MLCNPSAGARCSDVAVEVSMCIRGNVIASIAEGGVVVNSNESVDSNYRPGISGTKIRFVSEMNVRSKLRPNGRSGADNCGSAGKSLVDRFIANADGDNLAPISAQGRDDSTGLAGCATEIENTEE